MYDWVALYKRDVVSEIKYGNCINVLTDYRIMYSAT